MSNWTNIDNHNSKFRLLCNHDNCSLSLANLINGKLNITTIHGSQRHSFSSNNEDMLFIISQYLYSLSQTDREKMLQFFHSF